MKQYQILKNSKSSPFILFLIGCFQLIGCSTNENQKTNNKELSTTSNQVQTLNQLEGRWQEEEDSLNVLKFAHNKMIQFYNGSEINRYPVTIFNGFPGKGGYEDTTGRVIQIEESKDNYHHFQIVILDSNYLELKHRGSGITKFYKRLKN